MASELFNIAKGRLVELYNRVDNSDPTNAVFVVVLLKVAEADGTLRDYDTLDDLLNGSNTEADFTNYARQTISDSDLSAASPDDTNDRWDLDMADITWTSAGGASNNSLVKMLLCYDNDSGSGDDTDIIPLIHFDFVATTDGNNLVAQFNTSGFFRAS